MKNLDKRRSSSLAGMFSIVLDFFSESQHFFHNISFYTNTLMTVKLPFKFKLARTLTIFVDYGNVGSYTIMAKPIKSLELHYPMIQFLIIIYDIH